MWKLPLIVSLLLLGVAPVRAEDTSCNSFSDCMDKANRDNHSYQKDQTYALKAIAYKLDELSQKGT